MSIHDELIKDLYVFSKRKEILKKETELFDIRTEKLAIFKGGIHFDNNEDKMKRLFELDKLEKAKQTEIDFLKKERGELCS